MKQIKIGTSVQVATGRNAGQIGVIKDINKDGDAVYVDFGRMISVNEGFGSESLYPDAYWITIRHVSMISENTL